MWLQCDTFFYGRINLANALTARRGVATQRACGGKGKRFVNAGWPANQLELDPF